MTAPRGLSAEEQAAWARLAQSVTPMAGKAVPKPVSPGPGEATVPIPVPPPKPPVKSPRRIPSAQPERTPPTPPRRSFHSELDGHWNRKLKAAQIAPDYTLDLHDHTLDAAYDRIISGIDQARGLGARVVLVVAGRHRGAVS